MSVHLILWGQVDPKTNEAHAFFNTAERFKLKFFTQFYVVPNLYDFSPLSKKKKKLWFALCEDSDDEKYNLCMNYPFKS